MHVARIGDHLVLYERYMASTMEVLKHEHDTLIELSLRCLIEMSLRAVTCMVALVDVNTWNHGDLFHAPFLTTLYNFNNTRYENA